MLSRARRSSRATILAWITLAVCVVAASVSATFIVLIDRTSHPEVHTSTIVFECSLLIFPVLGLLIVRRHPDNHVGWLFCLIGLAWLLPAAALSYAVYAIDVRGGGLPGAVWAAWIPSWAWMVGLGLLFTFLLLLFPSGRLLSRRWRFVAWLAAGGLLAGVVSGMLLPGQLTDVPLDLDNPIGIAGAELALGIVNSLAVLAIAVAAIASVASLVVRFRRSRGVERQQMKWIVFSAGIAVTSFLTSVVAYLISDDLGNQLQFIPGFGMFAIVIGAGIAILRYRLYDIDIIINRTLVYGALTASLFATYLLLILGLGAVGREVAGYDSTVGVAVSTLAVAALVRPLRSRIQSAVDRRFYRRKYDAARIVETFSARLRDEIDLPALSRELQSVVVETMQPAHVSIWLRGQEIRR